MTVRTRPVMVGDLRLVRPVGSGGEGEVWEARDGRGRRRALKLVRPGMLASPGEVTRRGAHLRRIDHPALVRVHRSGVLSTPGLEGWGFLEMDFVDGSSLACAPADHDWLERLRPLAEALDLLHAGIWSDGVPLVHRDVKPANLLESPSGDIVLVDCSSLRGADTRQLTRIGTPVFAAPEVVTGRFGPAADVYSFAATVVALHTGARGDELVAMLDRPWSLGLPAALARALSPYPEDRPRRCASVLGDDGGDWLPALTGDVDGNARAADGGDGAPWAAAEHGRDGVPWAAAPQVPPSPARETTPPEANPMARAWPPLLALTALAAMGTGALLTSGDPSPTLWVAACVAHVLTHVLERRPLALAIAAPPVSWAYLLAARMTRPGRRRAWAEVSLTGGLVVPVIIAGTAVVAPQVVDPVLAAVSMPSAVAIAGAVALGSRPVAGGFLRLVLLPVWAAGFVMAMAAAVILFPLLLLLGRPGVAFRLAGRTLRSVAGLGPEREPAESGQPGVSPAGTPMSEKGLS